MNISYSAVGALNRKEVNLEFSPSNNKGIYFVFPDGVKIQAQVSNIINNQRNTVIGDEDHSLCFVEHLLAAIHLLRIENLNIHVDGYEIPLLDGSAKDWQELLSPLAPSNKEYLKKYTINNSLQVTNGFGKSVIAVPSDKFMMTFMYQSPYSSERIWVQWQDGDDIESLTHARTFAPRAENKLLGLDGVTLGYDENGFDQDLRMENEPAYHKLLDLYGDLSMSGINPLDMKAHFISYQGSHQLNTDMAKLLLQNIN